MKNIFTPLAITFCFLLCLSSCRVHYVSLLKTKVDIEKRKGQSSFSQNDDLYENAGGPNSPNTLVSFDNPQEDSPILQTLNGRIDAINNNPCHNILTRKKRLPVQGCSAHFNCIKKINWIVTPNFLNVTYRIVDEDGMEAGQVTEISQTSCGTLLKVEYNEGVQGMVKLEITDTTEGYDRLVFTLHIRVD